MLKKQPNFTAQQIKSLRSTFVTEKKKLEEVRRKQIQTIAESRPDSFYFFDIKSVVERVVIWKNIMPRVELFYAAKCNPDFEIVKACVQQKTGFDVASVREMQDLLDLGADPEKFIFANPIKTEEQILFAKKHGVKKMTFDSVEELEKIKKWFPKADCVIRLATVVTTALYNLSEKFGVFMQDVPMMLEKGKALGLRIKGVCFHTGSGGVTIDAYSSSLKNAKKVFEIA